MKPLTFGSLFAGIGGFDLGFERAGMVCKWQVEIDEYATKVLAKHWPGVRRHGDVRTWPQPDTERVDVICGGFPCQDISYAGKGAGLAGERSGLFYEAMRIVRDMGPRIVVLENVAALLTRGMDSVLGSLASLGYDAEWHCIPAAAVGAPHLRDRVFLVAYSSGKRTRHESGAIGGQRRQPTDTHEAEIVRQRHWQALSKRTDAVCCNVSDANGEGLPQRQGQDASGARPVCGSKPSRSEWWQSEPDVGRVANGIPRRVDRLRGLGNAVVPQVAEYIGRQIIEAMK